MTQQLCPEPTMLAAFGRGELAEELFEQIATHVVDCSSCQRALAQLGDGSDALLAGLRHVRGKDAATPCPDTHPTQHNNSSQASAVSTPPGYELLGEVGRGGMGMVQRARDTRLNREVAVKLLREDYPADSAVCARFNDHPNTLVCLRSLAVAYCESKQSEKALPLFAEYFEGIRKQVKSNDPRYVGMLAAASQNLLTCERYKEAELYLRECQAIREKSQPNDWSAFYAQSMLGGALLGQKKYTEAEPILLKGYEGMKQRDAKIPKEGKVRLTEAVTRLVQLYDAWGKPAEAAKWRKELSQRKPTEDKSKH